LACCTSPKDVKVRFFEPIENWTEYGEIKKIYNGDLIIINTPPYKYKNIKKSVTVDLQLQRPDGRLSEKTSFEYRPYKTS